LGVAVPGAPAFLAGRPTQYPSDGAPERGLAEGCIVVFERPEDEEDFARLVTEDGDTP
jgi:hypothetical protein